MINFANLFYYSTYFTIQLIFATIHGFHYTFWYYLWVLLYYFSYLLPLSTVLSIKIFQFQQNKQIPRGPLVCIWQKLFLSTYFTIQFIFCFCYYLWALQYFLILFMGLTVLFQLTFTFIYSTFSKKLSVSTK